MAKKNPFSFSALATLLFANSEGTSRAEKKAADERKRLKKERLDVLRNLKYKELDPEHLTAHTADGVTVMVTKSKASPMWWVRAFKGEVSVKSPHGFPSCPQAMEDAPLFIDRVLHPLKKKRKKA